MSNSTNIPAVDFSFVRYANCWEDPELLIAALNPGPGKQFLSIASAGDNSLSLLASGATVIATDLNPAQLACAELRREAIRALDRDAFLRFCGISPSDDRLQIYQAAIRVRLGDDAQRYWDAHHEAIAGGFIHDGKFERYFHLFRKRILPWIHRRSRVQSLLQPRRAEERQRFYDEVWNNRRWQLLFRIFFSKTLMGRLGRDPEFFKHVEGSVATRILTRAEYALTELDTSQNPYLTYILTGTFGRALPHYLQPESYDAIRQHIDNLNLRLGSIDAVAAEHGPNSFDGYNLSDIFEYLSPEQCRGVYERLLASGRPHARLAYWNMLVPRSCPEPLRERVVACEEEANALFLKDRAFFYSRFVVEEIV